ncbi:MAG: hypothetical protein QOI80_201 [Solirubrobacteraceae bacterium]|jgi:hypothetical protein|nr:hypothetical protein [Solirubrobacteraceae bacterium]
MSRTVRGPRYGTSPRVDRAVDAALKPGQWVRLVDRLDEIDNPLIRARPSNAALSASPKQPSATG